MASESPSDAGLVHSALGGDVASFSTLLDRYRASLYAAITVIEPKFVNPPDDPQHCPPAVTQVLFHDGADQVRSALGYFQPRPAPKQA